MKSLALTDCIRATPSRTIAALTCELSFRARRSLGRDAGYGSEMRFEPEDEIALPWMRTGAAEARAQAIRS